MIIKLIMWLCHIQYKKYGQVMFYIKGYDEEYPRYLIYTENERIYKKFDEI